MNRGKPRAGFISELRERLERQCTRCDYTWDEALPTDDQADGGLSIDQLAHALDNCTPYPVELHPEVARHMAERLMTMTVVLPNPEHPLWQPEEPAPAPVAPQGPNLTDDQRRGIKAILDAATPPANESQPAPDTAQETDW
ncbi:hypothetical protein [Streptomyces prasinus]|uniref:hypothetical protein n=1 Tax=Streptomyces prasinus TaxID=67345 RepID=UPI00369AF97B